MTLWATHNLRIRNKRRTKNFSYSVLKKKILPFMFSRSRQHTAALSLCKTVDSTTISFRSHASLGDSRKGGTSVTWPRANQIHQWPNEWTFYPVCRGCAKFGWLVWLLFTHRCFPFHWLYRVISIAEFKLIVFRWRARLYRFDIFEVANFQGLFCVRILDKKCQNRCIFAGEMH